MNCYEINQLESDQVLSKFGIEPVSKKGNEYLYHAPYREDKKPSLSFNIEKKVWVDYGTGFKGKMVDLLMKLYKTDSVSEMLSKFNQQFKEQEFSFSKPKENKHTQVKEPSKINTQSVGKIASPSLMKYLSKRGISKKSWQPYIEEIRYSNNEKQYFALAFKNDSDGYEIRNEVMKTPMCMGKKDITTLIKSEDELIIFEGFFDMLSFIELGKYDNQSIMVLNSTVNTGKCIKEINLRFAQSKIDAYLDNDEAGKKAFQSIANEFPNTTDKSDMYSPHNDLNDMLKQQNQQKSKQSIQF